MTSWIDSANAPGTPFPVHNLPYGVCSSAVEVKPWCAVALGDTVANLGVLEGWGLINAEADHPVFTGSSLNAFMAAGPAAWRRVRAQLTDLFTGDDPRLRDDTRRHNGSLLTRAAMRTHMPFEVAEYTDFYAGRHHACNVGSMVRGPENALPPNWLHIPIGYNGRASTVVVSGTPVVRPLGQTRPPGAEAPVFGPSRRLDFELELGAVVGVPNRLGRPLTVAEADAMIFGYVLLNDWSARDLQAWEYQPLGPFQAKAFATSISPWVVPAAALEPVRVSTPPREVPLLPYLREPGPMLYDIQLEVDLQPAGGDRATTICRTNYREIYYSAAQQLAHHAVCGCAMRTGDLLGSGTISGPEWHQRGSLLELAWGGTQPLTLETGETRSFLEDGDIVTLTGWAHGDGGRIGFGPCTGQIAPAPAEPAW